jgi:hypothetical protein
MGINVQNDNCIVENERSFVNIPIRNLHFIMGTIASHPKTFIMWDAALGCGPRGAIEAAGDVLASNLDGTVSSPDGMQ